MNRASLRLAAIAGALVASLSEAETVPLRVPFVARPATIDVEGKLEFLAVGRLQSSSPSQDPQGKLRLRVSTDLSPRLRFVTDLTGTAGGTPRDPSGAGVYDLGHVRQDLSPSLEIGEAYLDVYSSLLDLRLGLQKFAWGRLDRVQPNDLLNPQKYYDPLLEEENDRKIGVPAIAPTLNVPPGWSGALLTELRLAFVWVPIYVPYYFPDEDERWYPPIWRVPAESSVQGLTVENQSQFVNAPLPSRNLEHSTYAARFSGLFAGADFAAYYFEGFDPAPALGVAAVGFASLDPLSPQLLDVRSEVDVFPQFDRIRAVGGDVAYRVFDATLRLEGAYVFDRLYPRNPSDVVASEQIGAIDPTELLSGGEQEVPVTLEPVNVRRDGVDWGVGGDTFVGDTFLLLQVNQTAVLHNDVDLLISDFETLFSITLRRGFLDERLKAELVGLYAMQGVAGIAHPRLTYNVSDHLDVRVGYIAIEGHASSLVGEYKHNDEAYVRARLLF
jgi:hypothetical protein